MQAYHHMPRNPMRIRCDDTGEIGTFAPGGWVDYHITDSPFAFMRDWLIRKTCPACNGDPASQRIKPPPPPPLPPKRVPNPPAPPNTGQQNGATNEIVRKAQQALSNSVKQVEIRNAGTKFVQVGVVLSAYGPAVGEVLQFAENAMQDRLDQQNKTGKYGGRPITVHQHWDSSREYPENGPFG